MTWNDITTVDEDKPLSPSAIKTFLRCPKQYEFAYVQGIKNKPNLKMAFGSSIHKGIEVNYAHKFLKKKDLPVTDVQDAFRDDFRSRLKEEGVEHTKVDLGAGIDEGVEILGKYQKMVAPNVQPVLPPELDLVAPVPGSRRRLRAIIDVVADVSSPVAGKHKNVVRDTKTTTRMYSQEQADTDPQLTIGAYLLEKAKGIKASRVQFDVIVRKKGEADMRNVTSDRSAEEFAAMEKDVATVAQSIHDGRFYRTSNHQTCNWCGYNKLCFPKRSWVVP